MEYCLNEIVSMEISGTLHLRGVDYRSKVDRVWAVQKFIEAVDRMKHEKVSFFIPGLFSNSTDYNFLIVQIVILILV